MFRILAILAAVICLGIFGILLFDGARYMSTYGIAPDQGGYFLARRAAPVFAGLAVILWLLRDLPIGSARTGLCLGMAVMWFGIAATGVLEYATGQAGFAILVAAVAEVAIGMVFLAVRTR